MTPEIWTMIGVGVAIAALILVQARHSNRLIHDRIETVDKHMNDRFQSMETQLGELRERMAYFEGLLKGLREAYRGNQSRLRNPRRSSHEY